MLRLLLFVLPLGLDTLGVSISLGIKSQPQSIPAVTRRGERGGPLWSPAVPLPMRIYPACRNAFPAWLGSALLFSLAETVMPLVGLTIGSAVSLFLSGVMHILGPLLLIGVGLWELLEEVRKRLSKRKKHKNLAEERGNAGDHKGSHPAPYHPRLFGTFTRKDAEQRWGRQLMLALSVSLDELAIGFSLAAITSGLPGSKTINTITLCILIGLQGFLMTLIGLTLGRTLRVRVKSVKEWTEFLSCFLLIALGVWLLIT